MTNLGKLCLKTGQLWTRAELHADLVGPQGDQLIDRLRQVLDYFQPQWYWIENPWLSRIRDYITDLPDVCVDYCQYSDWRYRERTRLWTNIPRSGSCVAMAGKKHRVDLINRKGGYLHEKYRVPARLIEELLGCVNTKGVNGIEGGGETSGPKGVHAAPPLPAGRPPPHPPPHPTQGGE
jgi:hypothetical protein